MKRPIPKDNEIKLRNEDFIVSKTDKSGKILYGNQIFIQMSGYSEQELLNQPHNILRHPDMPSIVFELLWERIKNKKEIYAYVKNLAKDGSYYWVFANVTASLNTNGEIRDFHSVRRKPSEKAMKVIPQLYKKILEEEKQKGVKASQKLLFSILEEKGVNYDEFILSLQS